jgi:hypothetical protein
MNMARGFIPALLVAGILALVLAIWTAGQEERPGPWMRFAMGTVIGSVRTKELQIEDLRFLRGRAGFSGEFERSYYAQATGERFEIEVLVLAVNIKNLSERPLMVRFDVALFDGQNALLCVGTKTHERLDPGNVTTMQVNLGACGSVAHRRNQIHFFQFTPLVAPAR